MAPALFDRAEPGFEVGYDGPSVQLGMAIAGKLDRANMVLDVAAAIKAVERHEPLPRATATTQLVWTGLGILLLFAVLAAVRDPRLLQRFTYTAMVVGLALLVLPLVPGLGVTINGARIWIRLAGLSFQPAEIAKIALIVFFSGYLVVKRDALAVARTRFLGVDVPRGRDLGPILVAWLVSVAVLVFETDLGTSLLFFALFVALLYPERF